MAEIAASTLLPNEHVQEMVAEGTITQLHRGDHYAAEGDRFEIDGETYEVVEVSERKLGDMTDADARAEGSPDLEHYRERLDRAHDNFEWDDDADVVVHRFERVS